MFFVSFLLVFCSCFVPPFCYWFAPVMLQNRHPFGTVLVLFSVTLLGVSCEPLERVIDGFPPPHISRLPLGFSWVPLGLNTPTFSLFILCSFQPGQPLIHRCTIIKTTSKPHQNIIKNCLHFACVLIAFQKTRTKTLLVCMNRQVRYTDCPFQKCSTLRGDIEKTGIAPGSFLCLWRLHGLCAVRWLCLSSWMDVDIPLNHSPPGSTPGASKCHTAWLWLCRYTHIQRILGT